MLDAFYHGLAEAGQDNGLRVLLYAQPEDEQAEVAIIDELVLTGAADAVVLTATSADDERPTHLRQQGTTFCAFGRPWGHDDEPHDWVDVDGAVGTGLAVQHLVDLGRRRIAYLGWPGDGEEPSTGTDRRRWLDAVTATAEGAPVEAHSVNDAAAAEAVVAQLLDRPDAPDAIVCASDTLALGAHRAALALPGDRPTVVGFDATPVAAALGLASVAQPINRPPTSASTCSPAGSRPRTGPPGTAGPAGAARPPTDLRETTPDHDPTPPPPPPLKESPMTTTPRRRRASLAALAIGTSLALAACGGGFETTAPTSPRRPATAPSRCRC